MSIKLAVLQMLEQQRTKHLSGQQLALVLGVSRSAVWKAIKALQAEGYSIAAVPNLGYALAATSDLLSVEGIRLYLSPAYQGFTITSYKTATSTNLLAKGMALAGAKNGSIIVAEEQTAGKGRFGRAFFSPAQTGIYLSLILRPDLAISQAALVTTAAAVAICRTIAKLTNLAPRIKWVNDIFLNDKKIAGILTEAVSNMESGMVEYLVLGIGLNFKTTTAEFPPELQELAGALFQDNAPTITRNQFIGELCNNIFALITNLQPEYFMEEYKSLSLVLNSDISYVLNGQEFSARAIDIAQDGGLIIENLQGVQSTLQAGEITIRRK
ncbi:MAG: biotin--[acetyl-CoA-carboxylase] ligase [Clostridia bacterium]